MASPSTCEGAVVGPAAMCTDDSSAAAATTQMPSASANDILKSISETGKLLQCFQALDNSLYIFLKPENASQEALLQNLQMIAGRPHPKLSQGHEKEVVCVEDLLAAIRTYANQVIKRDVICTQPGEEGLAKARRTMLDPLLELHRVFANASANILSLYHLLHKAMHPGIPAASFFSLSGSSVAIQVAQPAPKKRAPSSNKSKAPAAVADKAQEEPSKPAPKRKSEDESSSGGSKKKRSKPAADEDKKKSKKKSSGEDNKKKKKVVRSASSSSGEEEDQEDEDEYDSNVVDWTSDEEEEEVLEEMYAKRAASLFGLDHDDNKKKDKKSAKKHSSKKKQPEMEEEDEEEQGEPISSQDLEKEMKKVEEMVPAPPPVSKPAFGKLLLGKPAPVTTNGTSKKPVVVDSDFEEEKPKKVKASSSGKDKEISLDLRSLSAKMVADHASRMSCSNGSKNNNKPMEEFF